MLRPIPLLAGEPYFASFEILTMRPVEMVGEKLRTLAQRQRGTDLADWVLLEQLSKDDHQLLPQVRQKKFKLVRDSFGANELIARIDALQARYEADVRALDHSAPDFETARASAVRLVRLAWA